MGRPTKRKRKRNQPKKPNKLPLARNPRATLDAMFKHVETGKQRSCGSCTACCTLLEIHDLPSGEFKPAHEDCPHQQRTRKRGRKPGCKVYEDRPPSCRAYECYWKQGLFEARDRPDRLGLMVDSSDGALVGLSHEAGFPVVSVREVRPYAHRDKRFKIVMAGLLTRNALVYHGEGYPYLMAPTPEMHAKLLEASDRLERWSKLADQHREGEHDEHVPECPTCEGACPVHTPERGGFYSNCLVCREAMQASLLRARDEQEARQASSEQEATDEAR